MSSGTSTSASGEAARTKNDERSDGLQPWQFFVLAGLGCATALAYLAAGSGVTSIVLLSALMATSALVGMAALRMLRPLVSAGDDRTAAIGQRARAALEREKLLTLRSIKELEFDRAMGKLSDADWTEMSGRLRSRAASLMRRLDASGNYRAKIEADLAQRLEHVKTAAPSVCPQCSTTNDTDARFCKSCGQKL